MAIAILCKYKQHASSLINHTKASIARTCERRRRRHASSSSSSSSQTTHCRTRDYPSLSSSSSLSGISLFFLLFQEIPDTSGRLIVRDFCRLTVCSYSMFSICRTYDTSYGLFCRGKKFSLSENANLGPPEPAPELPCVSLRSTHGSEGAGGVLRVLQSSVMVQGFGFRAYRSQKIRRFAAVLSPDTLPRAAGCPELFRMSGNLNFSSEW